MQISDELETVDSIEAWSQLTFGQSPSLIVALSRANAELSELLMATSQPVPDSEKVVMECADTAICMCRAAAMLKIRIDLIFNSRSKTLQRAGSALSLSLAANGHMAVLMRRIASAQTPSARDAAGYVELIVLKLAQICEVLGSNLGHVIAVKMPINRARNWRKTGEGIGQHIEE